METNRIINSAEPFSDRRINITISFAIEWHPERP